MSINGIHPHLAGLGGLTGPGEGARTGIGVRGGAEAPSSSPASGVNRPGPAPATDPLGVPRQPASLPAEPPPGTDPELWSVLSAEERVFFARIGAMGPLTYGRIANELRSQPAIARGGRIDLKV